MISISDLIFAYASGAPIFQDFDWNTARGEAWAVIGPSGCGKSTLLYLIAGLRRPVSGTVTVGGTPIIRPRPETGLILQDHGLLPWATVRQNIELGLQIRAFYGPDGKHTPENYKTEKHSSDAAAHWLERLGIAELVNKYPGQISGGQRQRAAIARTLVMGPDLLLMDEPFSSLDAPTREDLQNVVISLQAETGIAVIVVTHSIEEAVMLGQKILVLHSPPNTEAHIIENPGAANPGFRNSTAFLDQSARIRQLMGLAV